MSIDAILILIIFIIAFVLILGEFVHRTLAAWGGAVAMLIIGKMYGTLDWCSGHGFCAPGFELRVCRVPWGLIGASVGLRRVSRGSQEAPNALCGIQLHRNHGF